VPVVLLVAAIAILVGVVLASLGRAGEMADFPGDTPPMEMDEVSATDVALLRPPMSLWGYNAQATEDALRVIAQSVTERDVEIATLRRELAELRGDPDGARAAGIGGPRVSRPAPPARADQAHDASTITSVPVGRAYRAVPPAAAPQPAAPPAAAPPGDEAPRAVAPGQPGAPRQHGQPGQDGEMPFWAWQHERGSDD